MPISWRAPASRSNASARGAPCGHEDSSGRQPAIDRVTARFRAAGAIGENLFAAGDSGSRFKPQAFVKLAVSNGMASDEHRPNILSPDCDMSGIGAVVLGDAAYAAQIFRGAAPAAGAPK
jgi:uncharacterized protein YkwD